MTQAELQDQALTRAKVGQSTANFAPIINGFAERGIPVEDILPRENVFTFNAWKALGRKVKKGEHGVRVSTFREGTRTERNQETGEVEVKSFRSPWFTTVFHLSQTEPINGTYRLEGGRNGS